MCPIASLYIILTLAEPAANEVKAEQLKHQLEKERSTKMGYPIFTGNIHVVCFDNESENFLWSLKREGRCSCYNRGASKRAVTSSNRSRKDDG
jgi:hypothetical protein